MFAEPWGSPVSGSRLLAMRLLVAAAYAITGWVGLQLALPPGYASAIWPPAGIAMAATLLLGSRIWPGVFLGMLVLSGPLWNLADSGSVLRSATLALTLALGAAAQAVLGRRLVLPAVRFPLELTREREILSFLVLAGPVACLLNASIATTALAVSGTLPLASVPFTWFSWWVGDSIGVLLVTPVILILAHPHAPVWVSRRTTVALPLALIFMGAVAAFLLSTRFEQARQRLTFEDLVKTSSNSFVERLGRSLEVVEAMERFFASSEEVTREEFGSYAQGLLQNHPDLVGIAWAPLVSSEERAGFEARVVEEGLPGFRIWERGGDQQPKPAAHRPTYTPILFVEPFEVHRELVGHDISAEPIRHRAQDAARDTGTLAMTERLKLFAEKGTSFAVRLFRAHYGPGSAPVTVAERRSRVRGFLSAAMRLENLMAQVVRPRGMTDVWTRIIDLDAPDPQRVLHIDPPPGVEGEAGNEIFEHPGSLVRETSITVGGRRWLIQFARGREYLAAHRTWFSWFVLAVGLSFTSLVGAFLLILTGRAARVELLVEERTRALQSVNDELREAQVRAEAANRAKSDFLANMSHEIRTPINGVLGMTEMLSGTALTSRQEEFVRTLRSSSEHLLGIVNDILDISRIEAGKIELVPEPLDLARFIASVRRSLETLADRKGLSFEVRLDEDLPPSLMVDAGRLRQILMNLCVNAIKFTEHGHVILSVDVEERMDEEVRLRFEVEDTGIGIPAEKGGQLFQKFTQLDASSSRTHSGSGLGLTICRELVTLLGGTIGFDSQPGKGSRFWFRLVLPVLPAGAVATEIEPADESSMAAWASESARPFAPSQDRARVLVVDDNPVNRMVVIGLMSTLDVTVDTAESGQDALVLMDLIRYDLVLMDCQMPVLDGYETTGRIRRRDAVKPGATPPDVAVIGLTAHAMHGDRERCLAAGMNDYLAKPVRREDLEKALETWRTPPTVEVPGPLDGAAASGDLPDPLDRDRFESLHRTIGRQKMTEMVDILLRTTVDLRESIVSALQAADRLVLSRKAHALRGACLSMGATGLARFCQGLEESAETAPAAELLAKVGDFLQEEARLRDLLMREWGDDLARLSGPVAIHDTPARG